MDEISRETCQIISDLPEIEHKWPRLSTEEFLRDVGLLLSRVTVELIDAPLEMGMIIAVYSLVFSAILVFELILVFFSSDMSSFRK